MSKYTEKDKNEVIIRYESGQTIALISKHTFNLMKQKCERLTQMVEILKTAPCVN